MEPSTKDLVVLAIANAKPGMEAELEQALREAAGPTRLQPGCVQFTLLRSSASPATLAGFERWAAKADHERHLQGAHIKKLMGRMADILAEPPKIIAYEVLDG